MSRDTNNNNEAFSESWMLFAAYTWAHFYGNYEGLVNSDTGGSRSGFTGAFAIDPLDHDGMIT
jgi:hypothetical protein